LLAVSLLKDEIKIIATTTQIIMIVCALDADDDDGVLLVRLLGVCVYAEENYNTAMVSFYNIYMQ
jgi:hypothetical protein